jgi:hypothetical protein
MKRCAAGQFPFFQQNDIHTAGLCKVIRDAGSKYATADNYDASLVFQFFLLRNLTEIKSIYLFDHSEQKHR